MDGNTTKITTENRLGILIYQLGSAENDPMRSNRRIRLRRPPNSSSMWLVAMAYNSMSRTLEGPYIYTANYFGLQVKLEES